MFGKETTYPNSLRFNCDEGFILNGSWLRKCLTNGTWSGNETKCQGLIILASFSFCCDTYFVIHLYANRKNTNRKLLLLLLFLTTVKPVLSGPTSVIIVEPVGTPLRLGAPWHFMGRPADERAGINMENVLNIEHFDR